VSYRSRERIEPTIRQHFGNPEGVNLPKDSGKDLLETHAGIVASAFGRRVYPIEFAVVLTLSSVDQ
jgi:hypothetical protein